MTAVHLPERRPGLGEPERAVRPGPQGGRPTASTGGWFARHPAWPISLLLVGIPLWWALGLTQFMTIPLAVPMLGRMYSWSRTGRKIWAPPGFLLWLAFLAVSLAGFATLGLTAPETIGSPLSSRMLSFIVRMLQYGSLTVMLLYAGNLSENELPRRRLAWLLGLVAIYSAIGGMGGVVAPNFQLTSPLAFVLPQSVANSGLFLSLIHPGLAQASNILGGVAGRPDAPFNYTNTWGSVVVLTVPWLLVGWWWQGTRRQRRVVAATLVILVVPFVYSLDRGAWIGAVFASLYIAARFAARGKLMLLTIIIVTAAVAGVAIAATPLQNIIVGRLHNGKSNDIRASQAAVALKDAEASPLVGYGDSRHMIGAPSSIAIGPTASCHSCGQADVGGNGQLWLLMVCSGFLGAALYLGFFAYGIWRYWRDRTPYGLAGVLVLLLSFIFMFTYDAIGAPLDIIVLSFVLLWRNEAQLRSEVPKQPETSALPPRTAGSTAALAMARKLA